MKKIDIMVGGMSCQHCVKAVERALQSVDGVKSVQVDLANNKATVEIDESIFDIKKAQDEIIDQGYEYLGVAG